MWLGPAGDPFNTVQHISQQANNSVPWHMARLPCPTNLMFVPLMVIVWQKRQNRCLLVATAALHYVLSLSDSVWSFSSRMMKRVKSWLLKSTRVLTQQSRVSIWAVSSDWNYSQAIDGGRKWNWPYTYLSLVAICRGGVMTDCCRLWHPERIKKWFHQAAEPFVNCMTTQTWARIW